MPCKSNRKLIRVHDSQREVQQAHHAVRSVESRASDLVAEMQQRHKDEIDQLQNVANEAYQNSQRQLQLTQRENERLLERIRLQEDELRTQRDEQREMRSVMQVLQDQVGLLRSQPQASPQNAAVFQQELMQAMLQLQNDVRALQNRPALPIVANPPINIPISTPLSGSSIIQGSA